MLDRRNISLYWRCQLIGWSAASLYWGLAGYTGTNFSILLAIIHFLADLLMYIAVTHLFRSISKHYKWHQLQPRPLLLRIVPATALLGAAFMILTIGKTFLIRYTFEDGFAITFQHYFNSQWLVTLVTGVRLMAIWILAYYLYHYAQRELKATRESARLALIAKDAQLDNLSSQLNPHFFFNSLNNIKALVLEDPHAARRAIDLLSELLRTALYKRDGMLIPLKEEMALINDYLELERIRFERRLETSIEIDHNLLLTLVPPLSIQALVENAIKHGITKRKEGGKITISVTEENGFLKTRVSNSGKLSNVSRLGLGLNNLEERLALQFNGKASFELKEAGDDTVSATIKIPIK
ncbi:histidine kinase [Terrimonas sp. NA20]|uniref:Histidine kinase n=1 Tax=Terrimonas ginsenosidimutans TaxID=2908004 RepID=A0ABS9KXN2_9BACT|nr:histidine kinase [Terrimonas ginsenosidimutans]MCG2617075.1 histidine kinase [Terrimonas ginsenosidimutans]